MDTGSRNRGRERERGGESDGVDLHSIHKHVQHLAHMAPLNVARLRSVCVFVSILIVLTGVCVIVNMSVHASLCVFDFYLHASVYLRVAACVRICLCVRACKHSVYLNWTPFKCLITH